MEHPVIVWIIEDNAKYRETLNQALDYTAGLHCAEAFSHCEAALDRLQDTSANGAPDVILLDNKLPGLSGLEGIGQLKALSPQTHIVMLTIVDDADTIFEAFCSGASGYLLKNAHFDEIMEAVKAASQGGTLMPSDVADRVVNLFKGLDHKTEYGLTNQEKEVLAEMAEGYSHEEIGARLFVAPAAIYTHIKHIYQKLHVHSSVEAVAQALRARLTASPSSRE